MSSLMTAPGVSTFASEVTISTMPSAAQNLCIGWVDANNFSRESMTIALTNINLRFDVVPFRAVSDCVYSDRKIDLLVYHSHDADTVSLNDIETLRERRGSAQLMVLSDVATMNPVLAREILLRGASGVALTNKTSLIMFVAALDLAVLGGTFVPRDVLIKERNSKFGSSRAAQSKFTPREVEVLSLLRQGRTNKYISLSLSLSLNTTKVHVRNVLSKMAVKNRTEAAMKVDMHPQIVDLGL